MRSSNPTGSLEMLALDDIEAVAQEPWEDPYLLDGVRVPSVTEILSTAGIIRYRPGPAGPAASLGSAVHKVTALDDLGKLDEASVADAVRPYLDRWRAFRTGKGYRPLTREIPAVSRTWRFCGRYDGTGVIQSDESLSRNDCVERILFDLKTGSSGSPWWAGIQLAGYDLLIGDGRKTGMKREVWYMAPGEDVRRIPCDDESDYDIFRAALAITNRLLQQTKGRAA